jgi:hypothetical protein
MLDTIVALSTTTTDSGVAAGSFTGNLVGGAAGILVIIGMWATFLKAQKHGWAAIIPFYNVYTLMKVAGRPGWWLILYIIPIVNIVIAIIVSLDVARRFGKSGGFGVVGLWLFPFVGYLMLGFGSAVYHGDEEDRAKGIGAAYPAQPVV